MLKTEKAQDVAKAARVDRLRDEVLAAGVAKEADRAKEEDGAKADQAKVDRARPERVAGLLIHSKFS